jgi:hypothetical protein
LTIPGDIGKPPISEPPKAHMKEAFDEKQQQFKPHDMGLQVSSGLDSEISGKGTIRQPMKAYG